MNKKVEVITRTGAALSYNNVKSVTLIDDESHGQAAIGGGLESGEVRLIVASPAVALIRIEAA